MSLITGHPRRAHQLCCFSVSSTLCKRSYGAAAAYTSASESLGEMPAAHTISGDCSFTAHTPSPILPAILQSPTSEDTKVQNNRPVKTAAGTGLCIRSSGSRALKSPSLCPAQHRSVRDSYGARRFRKYQAATTWPFSLPFIHPDTLEITCQVGKLRS